MFHLKNVLYSLNIILWGFVTFARIYDCFISNPIPIEAVKPSDWCVIIGALIVFWIAIGVKRMGRAQSFLFLLRHAGSEEKRRFGEGVDAAVIQVLVQVHRRDLYKQKHPQNARTGPAHGPIRALDVHRKPAGTHTIPTF